MEKGRLKPQNENFAQAVFDSFEKQYIMKSMGASLSRVSIGECEIILPFGNHLTQQHGYLHAGVIATIADSAAGYAAFTLSPSNASVLTTEFKINLLSPAIGEKFIARAKILRAGRSLQIVTSEVFAVENCQEKLCAFLTATIMTMPNRPEKVNIRDKGD
ncbi:MAG: PaaI family thioesterase [Bdellovibrionaceae bacterium]|nr:PaaI family thioesterase [Pseudobdellovibrionaceae bacterium]